MESYRRGGLVTLSPSQTPPRPSDKSARSMESNLSGRQDKEKGVNVQVLLRCRPLSDEEARVKTPVVISCNESRREVCAVQNIANKQIDRTFAFDRVFGPTSQQADLYNQAISPIVYEVLEGYNCTIFAYGQTGTGKTYTMEGGARKKNGEFPTDAGVIPRAVRQIFDILESQSAEYTMKVTFLELYNEEITDLLAFEETTKFVDDKSKKPIALMEDGKGGVLVRGLEEEIVCSANEIYKILEKGSAKRRTAETLLNKQSSRSHSIFSITIHIKEYTIEGEEMIKCGKLNLVDLAGSENISRSGARDGRAREAGEINKSLLTLGRVINALVEHSGHVPYRDSKLTRLLRDSLGGKTKTCIIATVSPSVHCLEETLSTLDYAHRAKNIKNKPEVNQKMMKSAMMKDLYSEIDRLKQEVYAAREKNGIYISRDRYLQEEAEKKEMAEKIEKMELESESKDKHSTHLQQLYDTQKLITAELSEKLEKTERRLEETEHVLSDIEEKYRQANATIKEKDYLISNLLKSEKALMERAFELHAELKNAASDVSELFAKIDRKDKIEDGNRILIQQFQSLLSEQLALLHKTVATSVLKQEEQLKEMEEAMQYFVKTKSEATEGLRGQLEKLKTLSGSGIQDLDNIAGEFDASSKSNFRDLNSEVQQHSVGLQDLFKGIASEADELLNDLQKNLHNQDEMLSAFAQQQREAHAKTVETTRSISKLTVNFFSTVDLHASNLSQMIEEAQMINNQKLSQLEMRFEESSANEERQLLEKVAQLLANSNARKKDLVQTALSDLRDGAASRTSKLQQEVSTMQDSTSSIKSEWTVHMDKTEKQYVDDTYAVESGRKDLERVLQSCMSKAKLGGEQWRAAQDSLLSLEKSNVSSIESIIRKGEEAHHGLRNKFSSAVSSVINDISVANKDLWSSIDCSLKLDHDARANISTIVGPSCEDLGELRTGHYSKTVDITENAEKCLLEEYTFDEPSCSTPKKRSFNLPTLASIEELRTPAFEELLQSFWEGNSRNLSNGDVKPLAATGTYDTRAPLITIN
uniref:Kinesin motor domain-containing protein n=1 Tax=Kalanchoe fedtschenkoi TaxID=63787 RepID=A0A7N0ZTP8_KALFE